MSHVDGDYNTATEHRTLTNFRFQRTAGVTMQQWHHTEALVHSPGFTAPPALDSDDQAILCKTHCCISATATVCFSSLHDDVWVVVCVVDACVDDPSGHNSVDVVYVAYKG